MADADPKRPADEQGDRTGWLELFFDLVFVTALGIVNEAVRDDELWTHLLGVLLATAAIFVLWVVVTIIHSRFPSDSPLRRRLMVVVMVGLMVGALGLDERVGLSVEAGQLGFALAMWAIGAMILQAVPAHLRRSPAVVRGIGVVWGGALLCTATAVLPLGMNAEYVLVSGVSLLMLLGLDRLFTPGIDHLHPVRPAHLMERFGLLSLIVLGEGFTVLAVALREENARLDARFFLLTFVLIFLLWQIFFDGALAQHRPFRRWKLAVLGQYLLIVGIVGMLDVMAELSSGVVGDSELGPFHSVLAGAITFLGFAILDIARDQVHGWELATHLALAAVNLAVVGITIVAEATLELTALLGIVLLGIDLLVQGRLSRRRAPVRS